MALERQKTFKIGIGENIAPQIENFLLNEKIDPASVQVSLNETRDEKRVVLTYGEREAIKKAYKDQGREYTENDEVSYCHIKDIVIPKNEDLDAAVNSFLVEKDVSVLSINRYEGGDIQGAIIFYVNLSEQKEKLDAKAEEVAKAKEELANKLASQAVKDVDLEQNDTVDKYESMLKNEPKVYSKTDDIEVEETVEEEKE